MTGRGRLTGAGDGGHLTGDGVNDLCSAWRYGKASHEQHLA